MGIENINIKTNPSEDPKTPEEQLGDFFDNTRGLKLKQELSPERYEEERAEFIAEGLAEEDLNTMLEKRTYEARFDAVTGLKNRRELFKKTSPKIKELFGVSTDDKLSDDEWLEKIKNYEDTFDDKDFYIMMSDISFLGLINDLVSHSSGDELLKKVAEKMQATMGECFRHGGDEITGAFEMSQEELMKMKDKTKKEVNDIKDVSGLVSSNLSPNIDIGFAKLSEALKIYKELLASEPKQGEMNKNVLRNLQNIWLEIADKRTSINKAKERIPLLIDRANNDEKIFDALRKAAYGIKNEELKSLQNTYNTKGDISKEIDGFIKRKEIAQLEQIKPSEKELAGLILKHAGIL